MAQVNIDWGMPPANPFAQAKTADVPSAFSQGFEQARQNAFQDEQRGWMRDQRRANLEAGQLYAQGNYEGAAKRVAQAGNMDAAYKIGEQNYERAVRAHEALTRFSSLLGEAMSPAEFEQAKRIAGQFGAKFDAYTDPDWQRSRDRIRLATNYEAQKLKRELDQREQRAKISKTEAEAASLDQSWATEPSLPGYIFNRKTGEVRPIAVGAGSDPMYGPVLARKWAETEGPKAITEASKKYADASDVAQTAQDMNTLIPFIYSGSWGGIQGYAAAVANKYLGTGFRGVAPTQLFESLKQKFVGIEGQKYKPLSNSDIEFIEKGLPTVGKDPDGMRHILGAMEVVAQREMLARELEMQWMRQRGTPPDQVVIQALVDARIPSYVEKTFKRKLDQNPPPPSPPSPPGPQPAASPPLPRPPAGFAVEGDVIRMRDGSHKVLRGGQWVDMPTATQNLPAIDTMGNVVP
jgi:hypothetical protein